MKRTILLILSVLLLWSVKAVVAEEAEEKDEPKAHAIQLRDVLEWKHMRSAVFSPDGDWFGYRIVPNEGNSSIVIKNVSEPNEYRYPNEDEKDKSYTRLGFSDDSAWAVVVVAPDWQEKKKLRKDKKPVHNDALVLNLESGATKKFKSIQSCSFPKEASTWLALMARR